MNTQEVIAKLNKYKEMLEQETDSDVRSRYQSKISQLEASLKEAEQKVEKLEEKVALEEKKELSEVEKKINKYKDFLESETDPDVKARFQKKIKELQDSLKEVKQEIKEEKKEVAEQKVEIKKAIKAVKSVKATKVEKKEAIQKVEKKVRERKEVSVKRTRRSKEIKRIIGDLDKLIEKNKKLKQKYTGKGVDVKKDASRSAKPFGYRFSGKHDYRVPTKAQIKAGKASGKVVYESRANRSDVFPKGQKGKSYAKLAKGGQMDDGGMMTKGDGIYENFGKHNINDYLFTKGGTKVFVTKGYYRYPSSDGVSVEGIYYDVKYPNGEEKLVSVDDLVFPMGNKYTLAEAKKMLDAEKSNNESFSWFVPDVDYEGEDYDQEYGVHLSDKGLLDLADEIYKKGGKTPVIRTQFEEEEFEYAKGGETSDWDEKMKNAQKTLAFLKKEAENNPSPKMKKSVSNFEEYIKKLNQNKYAKGGRIGQSKEDKARFAKPAGWRWKDSAVKKKIINSAQLSKSPSKAMREKYPNYVYFEDRLNKADKNPSRKYLSA